MPTGQATFCGGVVFTVLPAEDSGFYAVPGVFMLCRREAGGAAVPLVIGAAENIAARLDPAGPLWQASRAQGADEVHIHLLAESQAERYRIAAYLARLLADDARTAESQPGSDAQLLPMAAAA